MAQDTKNFKVSEFTCHCGCGHNVIDQKIIDMCQVIRDRAGVPIRVNSGCRCATYNANQNGVKDSFHISGKAADLSCSLGAKKLFSIIADLKARGKLPALEWAKLYLKKNFVHIDCGKKRTYFFDVGD
ncbi:MAG: hypothetical protein IJT58_00575 [Synergistaceae bacterium]|nr:hypothetical protein [Synergistaceae bacterium]